MKNYWRNVGVVLTGTATAQLIPILASLVIARLFSPSAFGEFSAWLSATLFLGIVFTARLDTALGLEGTLHDRKSAAVKYLGLITVIAFLASLIVLTLAFLTPTISSNISSFSISSALLAGWCTAALQTLQSLTAVNGMYKQLSRLRIFQSSSIAALQIIAGLISNTGLDLILAYCVGTLLSVWFALYSNKLGPTTFARNLKGLKTFAESRLTHIRLSMPASVLNAASAQAPTLLLAHRYGSEVAGAYALASKTVGAPSAILGRSILDVFKKVASERFQDTGECKEIFNNSFKALTMIGAPFGLAVALGAPYIFTLVFGESWSNAGLYAAILAPLFAIRFIASPLSFVVFIANKQAQDLRWQLMLFCGTILSLFIGDSANKSILLYSTTASVAYLIYIKMSKSYSEGA